MKLADLNPKITGSPDGLNEISFDCPECGPPFQIIVRARLNGARPGEVVWSWKTERENDYGWDNITIWPSINNQNHGRKKSCSFHKSIVCGELL